MIDKVKRLRLVPKTESNIPIIETFGTKSVSRAKDFKPSMGKAQEALRKTLNLGVEARMTRHNSITIDLSTDQLESIFKSKISSKSIEKSRGSFTLRESYDLSQEQIQVPDDLKDVIEFAYMPSPPEFFAPAFITPNISHYYLDLIDVARVLKVPFCHRNGWTGKNVRIAMTDTGFGKHPYFESQGFHIERVATDHTTQPEIDTSGHGTGESANVLAIAPDCQFIGVKHDDYSALALETALSENPKIITNSWGWNIDFQDKDALRNQNPNQYFELIDVENIIIDAIDDGVSMVFAAGNGHKAFPGCIPGVISVGGVSVAKDGSLSASSYASSFVSSLYPNRNVPDFCGIVGESGSPPLKGHIMLPVPNGSKLEGDNMPSNKSNLGWGIFSGTSAAAPQIAGCIGLLLSANPTLTPIQIKQILSDTAIDVFKGMSAHGEAANIGWDLATGTGLVNAFEACIRAQSLIQPASV